MTESRDRYLRNGEERVWSRDVQLYGSHEKKKVKKGKATKDLFGGWEKTFLSFLVREELGKRQLEQHPASGLWHTNQAYSSDALKCPTQLLAVFCPRGMKYGPYKSGRAKGLQGDSPKQVSSGNHGNCVLYVVSS